MAASIVRLGCRQIYTKCFNNAILKGHQALAWNARFLKTTTPSTGVEGMKINMPALSPTMTEGKIVKWMKQEGDKVSPGDVLCEIQTDKSVMSFETEEEGILAKILVEADNDVQVGRLIALMVDEDVDWKEVDIPVETETPAPSSAEAPPGGHKVPKPEGASVSGTATRKPLGPAVKSLLEIYGISQESLPASGPHGRLLKGDVLRYIKDNGLQPAAIKVPPPPPSDVTPKVVTSPAAAPKVAPVVPRAGEPFVDLPHTNMRKVIAKRLTESKVTIPHAYSSIDCVMNNLTKLRKDINESGHNVTVNDLIVKASAVALQRVPEVNSRWEDDHVVRVHDVDISVAVATESGLITPIVKNAASLKVPEITTAIRELAGKAREGRLQPHEFQGGSFTISNLGMYGITEFTAIINPPQSCIMAVGTSRLILDGDNEPCTVMTVTLSCDSRVVDEALASRFLEAFKDIIEHPACLNSGDSSSIEAKAAFAF